jgi:hypothetical protein
VRRGDLAAVAGHPDPADEALLPRFDGGLERPAGAQGDVPLDRIGQGMQLPQVDVVDAQPVKGPVQFLAGPGRVAFVALGGQEEPARLALQPRPDAHLRLAVGRGHVQVVHPVGEQDVQGLIRDPLGDLPKSRPAEDHPAAVVAGAAELCLFDGHETSRSA